MSSDYTVGYGKPPTKGQFKKGQSGNPGGRPKGLLGLKNQLKAELSEKVQITEGGVRKTVSKLGVIVKNVTASAAKGNIRAAELIFTKLEKIVGVDDLRPPTELTPEQQDFWNAMAKTMTFKIMLWKEQNQREDAKKAAAAAANKPNQIPNHDPVDNDTSTSDSASEDFAAGDIRMPER